jgi:hypothetical protein
VHQPARIALLALTAPRWGLPRVRSAPRVPTATLRMPYLIAPANFVLLVLTVINQVHQPAIYVILGRLAMSTDLQAVSPALLAITVLTLLALAHLASPELPVHQALQFALHVLQATTALLVPLRVPDVLQAHSSTRANPSPALVALRATTARRVLRLVHSVPLAITALVEHLNALCAPVAHTVVLQEVVLALVAEQARIVPLDLRRAFLAAVHHTAATLTLLTARRALAFLNQLGNVLTQVAA